MEQHSVSVIKGVPKAPRGLFISCVLLQDAMHQIGEPVSTPQEGYKRAFAYKQEQNLTSPYCINVYDEDGESYVRNGQLKQEIAA
jgi:hypothetical protein